MTGAAVDELHTASELRLGDVGRLELEHENRDGHGDAGGGLPPSGPPPAPRRRGYGGGRLPRWAELALCGAIVVLAFVLGIALGRVERRILEARR